MMRKYLLFLSIVLAGALQSAHSATRKNLPGKEEFPTAERPTEVEGVFDFGHVGVDLKMYHTYQLVNEGKTPMKITNVHVPCDCSIVSALDSIIPPGDTGFFRLRFHTKDDFGPTTRSFSVFTDQPEMPEVQFSYKSIIGQWFDGIKPDPLSLFFLPVHKVKKVTIGNPIHDEVSLAVYETNDTTFDVTLLKDKAVKGEALELEIVPRPNLQRGTYSSNITLVVEKKDRQNPTIITIPITIVRY